MNGMDEWQRQTNERMAGPPEPDSIAAMRNEIIHLRDYLAQIRNVCRDNAPESCNQRMALDFVHQVAIAALTSGGGE